MNNNKFPFARPRRLRSSSSIRHLVQESHLSVNDIIAPVFFESGSNIKTEISTMPGIYRYSLDNLIIELDEMVSMGLKCVCLFPKISDELKNSSASEALNVNGLYINAIKKIKDKFPELLVMTDIALDPYSDQGHDGIVDSKTGKILNDETLKVLSEMALIQAQAGADILGPSDMMDGRVGIIRKCLEDNSFNETMIMSYTAKYASAFYGPFRDALDSAPKKGDKKTYQMDYHNSSEAMLEADLDIQEGADILMVKPGLAYLDIIQKIKSRYKLPVSAYNVSGEYSMIKYAAMNGALDEDKVVLESLSCFKRAGADMILTYFAKKALQLLND